MAVPTEPGNQRAWFKDQDINTTTHQALCSVKDVENSHGQFRQRIDQLLGKDKPRKRVTTEEELLEQLTALSPQDLGQQAIVELKHAGRQLSSYTKQRKTGARKFGAQTQGFFKVFSDFVGAYSGIISLVKGAGSPYGEAAYETLSLLLIIVVNKSGNDTKMGDLVRDLAVAFPRLDVLMSVYPSTNLEACVAAVYVNVIMFAREAAEYYAHFDVRFFKAIVKPPSVGIDITVSTIKGKLAEVNAEAMVQLHARNQKILQGVTALQDENTRLMNKVSSLQDGVSRLEDGNARLEIQNGTLQQQLKSMKLQAEFQADYDRQERLDKFKNALGLPDDPRKWPETNIDAVFGTLRETFPGCAEGANSIFLHAKHRSHRFQHMTRDRILLDPSYLAWYAAQKSSLLFVCGKTELEGRASLQGASSWLSPAGVFVAKKIESETGTSTGAEQEESQSPISSSEANMSNNLCLFYSCQPGAYASGLPDHDTIRPLSVLVWKLCGWTTAGLTRHVEDFRSRVEVIMRTSADQKREALKALISLLMEMLQEASEKEATVWIVFDRLDQCDLKLRYIMDQLTRLLACPGPKVKILVTSDAGYLGGPWGANDVEKNLESQVFFRNEWDQRRTTGFERSSENLHKMNSA